MTKSHQKYRRNRLPEKEALVRAAVRAVVYQSESRTLKLNKSTKIYYSGIGLKIKQENILFIAHIFLCIHINNIYREVMV